MEEADPTRTGGECLHEDSSGTHDDDAALAGEDQCIGGSHTYYALSDFTANEDNQLDLHEGDKVFILDKVNDKWWWVELNGKPGYVPVNHLSPVAPVVDEDEDRWQDSEYFSSYCSLKIHLEMLSDKPRTQAYRTAIENGKTFIKDKVVLDFGAGTGILSLFCAQLGGAKKVYAVEASDIAEQAAAIIEHNHLSSIIEVVQSRGEDLQLTERVDLIISEWMGTLLLFELMIESVLHVRDKYLKEDGVMWPSEAELFLVPCSAQQFYEEKVSFWTDVYGFDFSPMVPLAQTELLGKPIFNHILKEEDCLASPSTIMKLHMKTLHVSEIEQRESNFKFEITKPGTLHGFGSWFDVRFGDIPEDYRYKPVSLSTSPSDP